MQLSKEEYARKRIEMPNSYPRDGIFHPHLTTINWWKSPKTLSGMQEKICQHWWKSRKTLSGMQKKICQHWWKSRKPLSGMQEKICQHWWESPKTLSGMQEKICQHWWKSRKTLSGMRLRLLPCTLLTLMSLFMMALECIQLKQQSSFITARELPC